MEKVNIDGKDHLYLYGAVSTGTFWWSDDIETISAKKTREMLNECSGDIVVHLNSGGGDAFEGVAIYNILMDYRERGKRVDIVIDSLAASAATIIALAGNTISGRANTFFMIHHAWSLAIGNAGELRSAADELEKIDTNINQTYKEKFNGSDEELQALLDAETMMTAAEALEKGFYDSIIDAKSEEPENGPTQSVTPAVSQEAPKSLLELYKLNKENKIQAEMQTQGENKSFLRKFNKEG